MIKTRKIILAAIFAALIFVFTAYVCHIPWGNGYIHLGDAIIFTAAAILPLPYAMLSAALGAGLADLLTGAAIWIPATIVIKPIMAFCCKFKSIGPVVAGVVCIAGYFLYEILIYGLGAAAADVFRTVVQVSGSLILYYAICVHIIKIIREKYT